MKKKFWVIAIILFLTFGNSALAKNIDVLFIGNSYTSANGLPEMVAKIAASDSKNTIQITSTQFTRNAAKLKQLLEEGEAVKTLYSKTHWDFVILQEQSAWALYPYDVNRAYLAAREWHSLVKPRSSNIAFFSSWARQPKSHWYSDPETAEIFKDAIYMQKKLDDGGRKLAFIMGAVIIPIGDYWVYINSKHPEIQLYATDGSHPSLLGTYATALVFYRYFTKINNVESVSYVPDGIDPNQAKILRQLLSR